MQTVSSDTPWNKVKSVGHIKSFVTVSPGGTGSLTHCFSSRHPLLKKKKILNQRWKNHNFEVVLLAERQSETSSTFVRSLALSHRVI